VKFALTYSNTWNPVNTIAKNIVRTKPQTALTLSPAVIAWCEKVMVAPEQSNISVFNSGTLILLCSGATITFSHHAITAGDKVNAVWGLVLTIFLAIVFTGFQVFEYVSANFTISDGIYGSTFFMATGFHGFHVFIGTCFLTVCLIRIFVSQFTKQHHFGFEAAAWYWHFVDVVWLFPFRYDLLMRFLNKFYVIFL
jgi:heme/copper-type cytochrome/quinol oxidase subunit 3